MEQEHVAFGHGFYHPRDANPAGVKFKSCGAEYANFTSFENALAALETINYEAEEIYIAIEIGPFGFIIAILNYEERKSKFGGGYIYHRFIRSFVIGKIAEFGADVYHDSRCFSQSEIVFGSAFPKDKKKTRADLLRKTLIKLAEVTKVDIFPFLMRRDEVQERMKEMKKEYMISLKPSTLFGLLQTIHHKRSTFVVTKQEEK